MGATNERSAGRKRALSEEQIREITARHQAGETVTALAKEFGISRQALSGYLNQKDPETKAVCPTLRKWEKLNQQFDGIDFSSYTIRMDYMDRNELCTVIMVDFSHRNILVKNKTDQVLHRAFGVKAKPSWEDFLLFMESRCFSRDLENAAELLQKLRLREYDPFSIIEMTKGRLAGDEQWVRITKLLSE